MMHFTIEVEGVHRIDYQKYINVDVVPYEGYIEEEMQSVLQLLSGRLADELRGLRRRDRGGDPDSVLLNADMHVEVRPGYGDSLEHEVRKAGPSEFPTRVSLLMAHRKIHSYARVYSAVGLSKQTFSNLMSFDSYQGADRDNILRVVFAVQPNLEEAEALLRAKGYAFRPTVKEDIVLRHCLVHRIFDPDTVNELLEKYDCKPLFFMS
jgi:O-acetyl-ADP-ribose deacetylase